MLLPAMDHSGKVRQDGRLTVQVEQAGDALMLRASGELSHSTAERFEAELRQAIDADASIVVLDLSSVGFIDSTGLRVLISAAMMPIQVGASSSFCGHRRRSDM